VGEKIVDNNQIVIVGAGLSGLTLAERFATVANKKVLIIEKRDRIGGNCYDFFDKHGVLVSKYGPHIFHTQEKRVYEYVKKFADWEKYEHQVSSFVKGKLVPIPVNIETINLLFGTKINNGEEMRRWLDERRVKGIKIPMNSEEVVLGKLGKKIYELMFRDYTKKQWGISPKELESEVLARIPIRYSFERGYSSNKYQIRPRGGFTKMMEKMIENPNIELRLNTDYYSFADNIPSGSKLFFTGPIDEFISYKSGKLYKLPYRSVKFVFKSFHKKYFQKVGVINYPSIKTKMSRSTEYKYLTGQKHDWTTISREYFSGKGEPLYPLKSFESKKKYEEIAKIVGNLKGIYFLGRLGKYKYINMDQAILEALNLFDELYYGDKKR